MARNVRHVLNREAKEACLRYEKTTAHISSGIPFNMFRSRRVTFLSFRLSGGVFLRSGRLSGAETTLYFCFLLKRSFLINFFIDLRSSSQTSNGFAAGDEE